MHDQLLRQILTVDPNLTRIYVMPISNMSHRLIQEHLALPDSTLTVFRVTHHIERIVAFRSTGWVGNVLLSTKRVRDEIRVIVHAVPYSEHSTFGELCNALECMNPTEIVQTVNVEVRE